MGSKRITRETFRKLFNMLNITNYKITQHPQCMASLTVPGLGHDSFHFNGVPKIHGLMSLASNTRLYTLFVPYNKEGDTFMNWSDVTANCLAFVSSTRVNLSRAMYDISVEKHVLEAKFFLGYVGNSSAASPIRFYLPGMTQEPLFEQVNQIVTVDKITRKPIPLPDWFAEKYKGKGVMDKPLIVKPKTKPQDTFVHKVHVQWSDTDGYQHTNYSVYPRFAVDSIEAALWDQQQKGCSSALRGLSTELVDRGIKQMDICYLRQSVLHDELSVHVWQEEEDDHRVFCSICSDAGVELCQVHFEYYKKA